MSQATYFSLRPQKWPPSHSGNVQARSKKPKITAFGKPLEEVASTQFWVRESGGGAGLDPWHSMVPWVLLKGHPTTTSREPAVAPKSMVNEAFKLKIPNQTYCDSWECQSRALDFHTYVLLLHKWKPRRSVAKCLISLTSMILEENDHGRCSFTFWLIAWKSQCKIDLSTLLHLFISWVRLSIVAELPHSNPHLECPSLSPLVSCKTIHTEGFGLKHWCPRQADMHL